MTIYFCWDQSFHHIAKNKTNPITQEKSDLIWAPVTPWIYLKLIDCVHKGFHVDKSL